MPQTSNKLSSFIGIILLIAIIIFTVFINFFIEKPTEIVEESEEIEVVKLAEPRSEPESFNATDFANFWNLENVHTDYENVGSDTEKKVIKLYENIEANYGSFNKKSTVFYGKLKFKNPNAPIETDVYPFKDFEIDSKTLDENISRIHQIGSLLVKYQINSVITKEKYGNFTCIYFKNGSRVFLVKKNDKVIDKYYYKLIQEAEYVNDSTKIAFPEMVRRFNEENEF